MYLPHHREQWRNRLIDAGALLIGAIILIGLIWLVCISFVDAVVTTAEIEEEKAKTWLAETYQRPMAYRLEYPTAEQMERTEALLKLQPIVREVQP